MCFVLPWVHGLRPVHGADEWRIVAALAAAYGSLGLVLGAGAGLALAALNARKPAPRETASADRLRSAAVATLCLAFAANLALVRPFGRAEAFSLGVGAALAGALLACSVSGRWRAAIGGLANAWVASVALLGGGLTGRELIPASTVAVRLAAAAAVVLAVTGAAVVASRLWRAHGLPTDRLLPARAAVAFSVAVCLVGAVGVAATRGQVSAGVTRPTRAGHRPNLIVVTLDTVRADHLSLYGYDRETTPFLTRFSERATVFTNAFATSDQTLTAHASIFTGLYGSWHGAYPSAPAFPRGRPLGPTPATLAEVLARNGYRTMAVVANYAYLGPAFGVVRGFRQCEVLVPSTIADSLCLREPLLRWMGRLLGRRGLFLRCAGAAQVSRAVVPLVTDAVRARAPFFLFVNYMDAHVPYLPPAPFDSLFPGRSRRLGPGDYPRMRVEVMEGRRDVTEEERNHFVSQYDGAIRFIDAELERLMGGLGEIGALDDSVVVICSDHGEAFGERRLVQHGVSTRQDQVRIPLVIRFAGQASRRVSLEPVSQIDLMPTVLRALGLEPPAGLPGSDLQVPDEHQHRALFSESFYLRGFGARFERTERAVVQWPLKLIVAPGTRELYDILADPAEKNDLLRSGDPRALPLLSTIEAWVRAIPPAGSPTRLDPDAIRRLRALGYVN